MASFSIGHRMRFTTKPGLFFTTMGVLVRRLANSLAVSMAASDVCRPRTSSTSAISGTGLKKCTPRKLSGLGITAASEVMEIDEVFDAISASALASAPTCRRILSLSSRFSVAASIRRSQDFEVIVGRGALDAAHDRRLVGRGELVLLDEPVEASAHRGEAAIDRRLRHVDHHRLDAHCRARLGNAVAHRAGADDAHALDCHDSACQESKREPGIMPSLRRRSRRRRQDAAAACASPR